MVVVSCEDDRDETVRGSGGGARGRGGGTYRQDSRHLRVEEAGHAAKHQQARQRRDAQQRQLVAAGELLLQKSSVSGRGIAGGGAGPGGTWGRGASGW